MIYDHYLAVKQWTPSFNSSEACFGRTMVWIRLSGLSMMYFEESVIRTIAAAVGKPIKVDLVTRSMERGRYARVCVELDLAKPVEDEVWVHDHWHKVEFESLHMVCSSCRCYGHVARNCNQHIASPVVENGHTKTDETRSVSEKVAREGKLQEENLMQSSKHQSPDTVSNLNDSGDHADWITVDKKKSKSRGKKRVTPNVSKAMQNTQAKEFFKPRDARDGFKKTHVQLHGKACENFKKNGTSSSSQFGPSFSFSAVKPNAMVSGGRNMRDVMVVQEGPSSGSSQAAKRKRSRVMKVPPSSLLITATDEVTKAPSKVLIGDLENDVEVALEEVSRKGVVVPEELLDLNRGSQ